MPYIPQSDRQKFENILNSLRTILRYENEFKSSEFNFMISTAIADILDEKGMSYTNGANIIGCLECIKLELYRRVLSPYEDQKMKENGDVYENVDKEP